MLPIKSGLRPSLTTWPTSFTYVMYSKIIIISIFKPWSSKLPKFLSNSKIVSKDTHVVN